MLVQAWLPHALVSSALVVLVDPQWIHTLVLASRLLLHRLILASWHLVGVFLIFPGLFSVDLLPYDSLVHSDAWDHPLVH